MGNRRSPDRSTPVGKVKRSILAIGVIVGLTFSLLMGITAGARGFGSMYPEMNLIAKPLVCSGGEMTYSRSVSTGATATYDSTQWFCVNESGERKEIDPTMLFVLAGIVYGLVFFAVLFVIVYLYWNSSIGPAKNGGPALW